MLGVGVGFLTIAPVAVLELRRLKLDASRIAVGSESVDNRASWIAEAQ